MEAGGDKGKKDKIAADAGNNNTNTNTNNVVLSEEAMKKCLEERKGEDSATVTCKSIVEAFGKSSSSSLSSSSSSSSSLAEKKPLTPLRLRSGCLTDV
ncbi:hypothetical protein OROMI_014023 [Orobanche minor]